MSTILLFLILLNIIVIVISNVTILKSVQVIYDKSPKLRIRSDGFTSVDDHDIILDLSSTTNLVVDKDYLVTKDPDGDGLILKLITNRKWADLTDVVPPVPIILSAVRFANNPKENLLVEPVTIAQVLRTPSIDTNVVTLYQTASNELRVNGTGFIGAKKVDLYFQPPLTKAVAYEDVTAYPLTKNQVVLRLRYGYEWRESPGGLYIIGIDTGGGPVAVNGDNGVLVADVKENLAGHAITVETHIDDQLLYWDDSELVIKGSGFNEIGNTLRWSNNLLGNNVNYTTIQTSPTQIKLRLNSGSKWRANADNLPGALTLLAVNAGDGFVAVGPTNALKGRDVAMIFERPQVFSNNIKIYRTHSHEFHISGSGFPLPSSGYKPKFKFEPSLTLDVDYTMIVISHSEVEITLVDGKSWGPSSGPLIVKSVNTGAGVVTMPGDGVHVAEIVDDVAADTTGGVEIFPVGVKVYQSALKQDIVITGQGFKDDIKLTLDPPLVLNTDYSQEVESKNKIILRLKDGKKWRTDPGFIIAKSITTGGNSYKLANNDGIRVAVVLADPVIAVSKDNYHESQSKLIVIEGSGFTNVADTKIVIRPSDPGAYKVIGVLEDAIRVQLKADKDWLPNFMSLKDEDDDKKVLLQVSSIDTGAGDIVFDTPITIGNIIKDRIGVICDDSCEFSFDGVCDDGSEPFDWDFYDNYFNYMDDDLGGFYFDEYFDYFFDEYYGWYDDYYMENEDYMVSACLLGTDCTDCGGVDAIIDYSRPDPSGSYETCTNTCIYPRDGVCDDPRGTKYCELGTDCQDCGPVGADNFTRSDDDGWWDDDDDYWTFNDGNFLDQTKGLEANRDKAKAYTVEDNETAASMFLIVLEGMVYTVGAIFAAAAIYLVVRWYKGQSVPFVGGFNPELNSQEFELAPNQRMPITPDEFRT